MNCRYHQLVLHDPVWYDHLPYVPFPPNWPVFTPKDKLAEWFESYARLLELNVWTLTNLKSATWDERLRRWTVVLARQTSESGAVDVRTLYPRHIVQATGHSGEPSFPSIKGMDSFAGDRLCHSSQFRGAQELAPNMKKHAVVVGKIIYELQIQYKAIGFNATQAHAIPGTTLHKIFLNMDMMLQWSSAHPLTLSPPNPS